MRILERENYYNVINGYKELFLSSKSTLSSNETFKSGTTFNEIYALYSFDRELRNIYMKYLLKLEKQLHTISISDIMNIMGFGSNWTNLSKLVY